MMDWKKVGIHLSGDWECQRDRLVSLVTDLAVHQVGLVYSPEIFVAAVAPEKMIDRFDDFQVG